MKKTILGMAGLLLPVLFITLAAQQNWDAKKNPVVAAINARYEGKYIAPAPAPATSDLYPEAGAYRLAEDAGSGLVSLVMDEQNKGIVWVKGLPTGTFRALLRRTPAVYKIPAQQNQEGKAVAEGTLLFDAASGTLKICIGKPYDETNPAVVFEEGTTSPEPPAVKNKQKKNSAPKSQLYIATKVNSEGIE